MITRVNLSNWMSHKNTEVSFNKGKILIFGKNGSGKTSIIEGILYGLFGSITDSYRSIAKTNKKDFIRDGAKSANIEVEFIVQNRKVNIKRNIYAGNKGEESSLYIDDKLKTRNNDEISKEVEKMLGIQRDIFLKVLYGAQDGIYKILNLRPKELKTYLDTIFGIEQHQTRIDRITIMMKAIDKEIKENMAVLIEIKKRYQQRLMNIEEELKVLKEKLDKYEKILKDREQREIALKQKLPEISKKYNEHKKYKTEYDINKGTIAQLRDEIKRLEDELKTYNIDLDKEQIRIKLEEIGQKLKEIEEKKRINDNLKDQKRDIELKIQEMIGQIKIMEEKNKDINYRIENYKQEINKQRQKIDLLNKTILGIPLIILAILLFNIGILSILFVIILAYIINYVKTNMEKTLNNMEKELKELNQLLEDNKKNINSLNTSIEDHRQKVEEINNIINQKLDDEELLKNEQQQLIEIERKLDRKKEIEAKVDKYKEELKNKEAYLTALLQELERLKNIDQEFLNVNSELSSLRSSIENIIVTIEQIKSSINARIRDKKELLPYLEELEQGEKNLELKRALWKDLDEINSKMKDLMVKSRARLIDVLNMNLEKYWNSLYYGKIYGDPKIVVNEEGYELTIKTGDKLVSVDRMSGGEKTVYALAMRLGILDIISKKLRVIILDEPTHNLDDLSIDNLIDNINKLAMESIDQFIIITHDDRLKLGVNWNQQIWLDRERSRDLSINYTVIR